MLQMLTPHHLMLVMLVMLVMLARRKGRQPLKRKKLPPMALWMMHENTITDETAVTSTGKPANKKTSALRQRCGDFGDCNTIDATAATAIKIQVIYKKRL